MKKSLEGAKSYICKNWLFLLIMTICSIALFVQMNEVVLYADDYALGMYSSGGLESAWDYFTEHYMTWGGGYTSLIVIILLMFPSIIWKLFLTSLLMAFVGLSVKMLCKNHPTQKWLVASILWSCIFMLSIWISREVIYWLDGSVAYLFSMFQVFIFFYYLYTRLFQGITKKYDYVLLPLVAFFAGWSSAQSGVMAITMAIILIVWKKLFKSQKTSKIRKLYLSSIIFSLLGFCIFYFAPGNSARMNAFTDFINYSFIERILYRFNSVTALIFNTSQSDLTAAPLFIYLTIGLISITSLSNIRSEKNRKVKITRLCCSIYGLIFTSSFIISLLNIPGISTIAKYGFTYINLLNIGRHGLLGLLGLLPYFFATLAILASLTDAFFICKYRQDPFLLTVLIMGYLAEFSMLMAPYSPLRTTFYTIVCMWLAIDYLFFISYQEKISVLPISLALFITINLNLCLFVVVLFAIVFKIIRANQKELSPRHEFLFVLLIFAIFATSNYARVLINYHQNKIIDDENIARILEYKETADYNNTSKEVILYLKRPKDEIYGFTGLAGIDWVENGIRLYFGLPSNTNLEYEKEGISQ